MSAVPLSMFEFGEFRIDPRRRTLSHRAGQLIALTPKHFDTLLYLVENAGEVLEKDRLLSAIWPGVIVEENNLSQAISQLRRILEDDGTDHRYILTVPRRGYRFVAEVRLCTEVVASELPVPEPPMSAADITSEAMPPGSTITAAARQTPAVALASSAAIAPPVVPAATAVPARTRIAWAVAIIATLVAIIAIQFWKKASPANDIANEKSIAVLPFVNFSGAREDEFFSDGITEDMVMQLAQISGLKVISRTSILEYKDSKNPLRDIARELGVAHILQGSVRRSDNRFRITAQLIDPAREGHLWAKSYDREIKDVLAVQSEVTAEIAEALKTKLLEPEKYQLEKRARSNADAYVLYRKGMHLISVGFDRTKEGRQRAREYFERVIEMDPASPLGYAGLANYYFRSALMREIPRPEGFVRGEALATKALAADDRSVEAHLTLAAIYSRIHWNWKMAERHAKRAVDLRPGDAEVWDSYSRTVLTPTGRLEESLAAHQRAVSLDPLNLLMAFNLASVLNYMNRCDEAIRQAGSNLELEPKFWLQHIVVARCHEAHGRFAEAIAEYRLVKRPWLPDNVIDELQAIIASPAGKADPKAYWRARLAWSRKYGEKADGQHYFTAVFAAQAGEKEEAFRYLYRAIDDLDRDIAMTKVDPQLDPLRSDPRFAHVLKRLNLN